MLRRGVPPAVGVSRLGLLGYFGAMTRRAPGGPARPPPPPPRPPPGGTTPGGRRSAPPRTRRERLSPRDVDLPERRRQRRTPGLRREEVAELANVSVDYVTRLEQARGLRPSPEVLDALAGALRLSDDERTYLFDLVRQRPADRAPAGPVEPAAPGARLVPDLSPLPAMLVDYRVDVPAVNAAMGRPVLGLR